MTRSKLKEVVEKGVVGVFFLYCLFILVNKDQTPSYLCSKKYRKDLL